MKKFLVIVLILAGAWYAFFGERAVKGNRGSAEEYLQTSIVKLDGPQIQELLDSTKTQVRLVHIYSAECILCRIYFSDITDMAKNYNGLQVIAIAVDSHPLFLASFLADRKPPFTPYLFTGGSEVLGPVLAPAKLHYDDNPPYTAVIDQAGQVREFEVGPGFSGRMRTYLNGIYGR